MITAQSFGGSGLPSTNWSTLSNKQWRAFLSEKEGTGFEAQLLAVLSYGNQVAHQYAVSIFGPSRSYNKFHQTLSRLDRLPKQPFTPQNLAQTAKVFGTSVAAIQSVAGTFNNERDALYKLLSVTEAQYHAIQAIPVDEMRIINIWRETLPCLQAQYEPMMERISKSLFQRWFVAKQFADQRDCHAETGPALCKAVRGYGNKGNRQKFITYAWNVTSNEIKRSIHKRFGKTALSVKLSAQYANIERQLLTAGKPAKPEQVFEAMGLHQNKISELLRSILRQPIQEGDLDRPLDELIAARRSGDLPTDLLELIEKLPLTPIERAALEADDHLRAFFKGENFSQVAKRLNKSTQAVCYALDRARIKVTRKLLVDVHLSPFEQQVFEARLVGKTFFDISDDTGMPISTIRQAYTSVKEQIHDTLGAIYGLAE